MKQVLLNSPDDLQRLRETHLPEFGEAFGSAIVSGNEDCPSMVEVYASSNPLVSDSPIAIFRADDDGDLIYQ